MMKHWTFWGVMVFVSLSGCRKEGFEPFLCNPEKYFPLAIGNYWIYDNYILYDNGHVEQTGQDSMYISGDTLMLGNRYFHLEGTFYQRYADYWLTVENGMVHSIDHYVFFACPKAIDQGQLYPVAGFDLSATLSTTRTDTLLSIGAGNFNNLILFEAHSMRDQTFWVVTYQFYYAKNIGFVEFIARPKDAEYEKQSVLAHFHNNQ